MERLAAAMIDAASKRRGAIVDPNMVLETVERGQYAFHLDPAVVLARDGTYTVMVMLARGATDTRENLTREQATAALVETLAAMTLSSTTAPKTIERYNRVLAHFA